MVEQQSCSLPFKRRSLTAETPPLFFNCNPERERGLRPSKGRSLRQQREGFKAIKGKEFKATKGGVKGQKGKGV